MGVLLIASGCQTATEEIPIGSVPPGAEVTINGRACGITPLTVKLAKTECYRVELKLAGYHPFQTTIVSVDPDDMPYVRFGLLADSGYYRELRFSPEITPLKSELIPLRRSLNPFEDFGERVLKLDNQLEEGNISAEEHARILAQLILAYE